jgi:hypothetical protein
VAEALDELAGCEAARERSTGEGKGEIKGSKVLRIVGSAKSSMQRTCRNLEMH